MKETTVLNDAGLEKLIPLLLREHPMYEWRSYASLAKELGIEQNRCVYILEKLIAQGIVVQSNRNDEHYGLLERVKVNYPDNTWKTPSPVLDPVTFQPCPTPCPAPRYKDNVVLAQPDMMEGMREALREVHKLICTAEKLNEQVDQLHVV